MWVLHRPLRQCRRAQGAKSTEQMSCRHASGRAGCSPRHAGQRRAGMRCSGFAVHAVHADLALRCADLGSAARAARLCRCLNQASEGREGARCIRGPGRQAIAATPVNTRQFLPGLLGQTSNPSAWAQQLPNDSHGHCSSHFSMHPPSSFLLMNSALPAGTPPAASTPSSPSALAEGTNCNTAAEQAASSEG